jgi:hypothetical protein
VESRQRRKIRRAGLSRDIRATAGINGNCECAVVGCAAEVRRIDDLQVGRIHLEDVCFDAVRARPDWSRDIGRLCRAREIDEPGCVHGHRGDAIGQGAADVSAPGHDVRVDEQWARRIVRRNYETNPILFINLVAGRQFYAILQNNRRRLPYLACDQIAGFFERRYCCSVSKTNNARVGARRHDVIGFY